MISWFSFTPLKDPESRRESKRERLWKWNTESAQERKCSSPAVYSLHVHNIFYTYRHWTEMCIFSSCLWHILHIQTLKLSWNDAMFSIWLSTGRFQVSFCREMHSCCSRKRQRDSAATLDTRVTSTSQVSSVPWRAPNIRNEPNLNIPINLVWNLLSIFLYFSPPDSWLFDLL